MPTILREMLSKRDIHALLSACSSLSFLQECCKSSIDDLLDDLDFILRKAPASLSPEDRLTLPCSAVIDREVLCLLETVLYQNRITLIQDPTRLFVVVYNELFWWDCPARSEHELNPTLIRTSLWRWMESWRAEHQSAKAGPWLRSMRPPATLALPAWGIVGEPTALSPEGDTFLLRQISPGYLSGKPWGLTQLATPGQDRLFVYEGGSARLYAIENTTPLATLPHQETIQQAIFVGGGRLLLTSTSNEAHAWSGDNGAKLASATPGPIEQLLPADDGPVLLHHRDGTRFWTLSGTSSTNIKGAPPKEIQRTVEQQVIKYRLEANRGAYPRSLKLIDTRTGLPRLVVASNHYVFGRFSPDGQTLLLCTKNGAQLWSTKGLNALVALGSISSIEGASFSRDGGAVCIAGASEVVAFRTSDGARIASQKMRCEGSLLLAEEGQMLVYNGSAWRLWDYNKNEIIGEPMTASKYYSAISPRGDTLVAAYGTLTGWALPSCSKLFEKKLNAGSISFIEEGDAFVVRTYNAPAKAYDPRTGDELPHKDTKILDPQKRIFFSYRGHDDETSKLIVYNAQTNRPIAQLNSAGMGDTERRLFFSKDGGTLLFGDSKRARLTALPQGPLSGGWRDDEPIRRGGPAIFSPSGTTALLDEEKSVSLWSTVSGRMLQRYSNEERRVIFGEGAKALMRQGDLLIARSLEDGRELWRIASAAPKYRSSDTNYAIEAAGVLLLDNWTGDILAVEMETGAIRYQVKGAHLVSVHGELFITANNTEVIVREASSGKVTATLPPKGSYYKISEDRTLLARSVEYQGIEIWELPAATLRHTIKTQSSSFYFLGEPLTIVTYEYQTPQSGNQDLNIETTYDALTGAHLSCREWWSHDTSTPPAGKLAPEIFYESNKLSVNGVVIALPNDAVVARAQDGALYVACTASRRLELYVVEGL